MLADAEKHALQEKTKFAAIVEKISYDDWLIGIGRDGARCYLQVHFTAPDRDTGEGVEWSGRKWLLSPHMTDSEVVLTAWAAIKMAIEHEAREKFRYRGRQIFGPHIAVDALWDCAETLDARA